MWKTRLTRIVTSSSFHDLYNGHDASDAVDDRKIDHDVMCSGWSVSVHKDVCGHIRPLCA